MLGGAEENAEMCILCSVLHYLPVVVSGKSKTCCSLRLQGIELMKRPLVSEDIGAKRE